MQETIIEFITTRGIDVATTLLYASLTFFIGLWLIKQLMKVVRRGLAKVISDGALAGFLTSLIGMVLKVLLAITVASMLGVQIATILALLGSIGLAIGLALQGSLANFAGGILILLFKPFEKGDFVTIKGIDGFVTKIDLLYTTLLTRLNRVITIPNGTITNDVIQNHSHEDIVRRRFYLQISYKSDIKKAKEILLDAMRNTPHVLHDPGPFTEVSDLAESGVELRVFLWCKPEDYFRVKEPCIENIKYAWDKHGIEMPYPQRVIHFENGDRAHFGQGSAMHQAETD